ncbi:MAG: cation:proton antiporter [Chlamydiales bacterium]
MIELSTHIPVLIFILGLLVVLSLWIKALLFKRNIPPLVGFIILGWLLRLSDNYWNILSESFLSFLYVLSDIGIIVLLFHIGYRSHINALIKQLYRASLLAISNILLSGISVFYVSYSLFSIAWIPSLFLGVAATATSIGITVSIWKEHDILNSREGNLLLDLVALDDIIAIILMGILFNLAPMIHEKSAALDVSLVIFPTLAIIGKLLLFISLCYVFSHFAEPALMQYLKRYESLPDPIITVAGIGLIIASFAAFMGFSVALGGFFAGISFSRDSNTVNAKYSLETLEDFFVPFFFIGIGFKISMASLLMSVGVAIGLLICAIAGKFIGIYFPARMIRISQFNALILAISMIPRAEVAMITMDHGLRLGDWAVSADIYSLMVLISLVTSIIAPLTLQPLLKTGRAV